MLKKTLNKYKSIYTLIIIFAVFFATGVLFFYSMKAFFLSERNKQTANKIALAETILFEQYRRSSKTLIFSERLIKEQIDGSYKIKTDSSKIIKIKAKKHNSSLTKVFTLPLVKFNTLSANDFAEQQLYRADNICEIWQKKGKHFIRIASSNYKNKNKATYMPIEEEPAKALMQGVDYSTTIHTETEIKLLKYFPIYSSGEIKFFIALENNKNLLSALHVLSVNKNDEILIFDKNEHPIFSLQAKNILPATLNLKKNYNIIQENTFSKQFNKNTLYYRFIPELSIYLATTDNKTDFNHFINKLRRNITIAIAALSILFVLFYFLILYIRKKREEVILDTLHTVLPAQHKRINNINDAVFELEAYFSNISEILHRIANKHYEDEIKETYADESLFKDLRRIRKRFLKIKEKEKKQAKGVKTKEKYDKAALEISDILQYTSNLEDLSAKIIRQIAQFTNAEQIGIFVVKEDLQQQKTLYLTAGYSYSKERFSHRELNIDDGLIGEIYMERKPVLLTEIPEDYLFIESGFGFQKPKCLFIFPLIFNNEVQAIIELGSINILTKEQTDFLIDNSEKIATTIANIKHSKQTELLLAQTTKQSEEIEKQRKTLEEKISTHRKQNRNLDKQILLLIEIIESIKSVSFLIEYDLNGNIIDISSKISSLFETERNTIITKSHRDIISDKDYSKTYQHFWNNLKDNKIQHIDETLLIGGKQYKFKQTYVPIKNARRKIYRILSIGTITE